MKEAREAKYTLTDDGKTKLPTREMVYKELDT